MFTSSKIVVSIILWLIIMPSSNIMSQPIKDLQIDVNLLVEDHLSGLEDENNQIDIDYLIEYLEQLQNKPINLNQADRDELESLVLLSPDQVDAILTYRQLYGDFISIYELQVIPIMNLELINKIRSFISVYAAADQFQKSIPQMLSQGRSTVYMKWKTVLEDKKGYRSIDGESPKYLGDKNQYQVRYKYNFENKLRYGLTMEKDAGETFFIGNNKNGFDYYSGYIYLKDYNRYIKSISIGDYNISLGQGLILNNSFGGRKSSYTVNIKKGGNIFRPYSSVSENNYNRGIAIDFGLSKNLSFATFYSYKKRDAGITIDSLDGEIESYFSSLLLDGLHRTSSEIAKKDQLIQTNFGGRLKYENNNYQVSINFLHNKLSSPLRRSDQLYNINRFQGKELSNLSIDYNYSWKNMYFYGESAMSDNYKTAHLHGLLFSPHPKASLAFLYRNFDPSYHVLNSNSFSESSGTNDENGFYIGMEFKVYKGWTVSAYSDFWSHKWIKFKQAHPSKGKEHLIKLRYYKKRKFEFYAQYFIEQKSVNISTENSKLKTLGKQKLQRLRLHFSNKINKELEFRNRIEFSFYNLNSSEKGYLIYQDVIYKPLNIPLSFTVRFAIFNTNGYKPRIYAYENDILYEFYIPAYYGKGTRYYLNLRYKVLRNITTEFRFSRTYLPGVHSISSGNEEISGNTKSEIKAQIKIKF